MTMVMEATRGGTTPSPRKGADSSFRRLGTGYRGCDGCIYWNPQSDQRRDKCICLLYTDGACVCLSRASNRHLSVGILHPMPTDTGKRRVLSRHSRHLETNCRLSKLICWDELTAWELATSASKQCLGLNIFNVSSLCMIMPAQQRCIFSG